MLNRKIALARLRATGTLSASVTPPDTLCWKQVNSDPDKAVAKVMRGNKARAGARLLAPMSCHAVLP